MFVIVGESGSGKDTILKELLNQNNELYKLIPYTTRLPRNYEINGVHYNFTSVNDFINLIDQNFFAEYALYNKKKQWYYGTAYSDIIKHHDNNNCIISIGVNNFRKLKQSGITFKSIYLKVDEKTRAKRLIDREDDLLEVFRRLIEDRGLFYGIEDEVDYIVENYNIKDTIDHIQNIINTK